MNIAYILSDSMTWSATNAAKLYALHVLTCLLVCAHVLRRRREASSSLLWIFLSWSLPVIGPLLYLMIGIDRVPDKAWRKQKSDADFHSVRESREQDEMPLNYWRSLLDGMPAHVPGGTATDINRTLDGVCPEHPLLTGNSIELLEGGDAFYPRLREDILNAEHHVHIESYIIGRGSVGRELLDLLARRASEGIRVRVLYDQFGSRVAHILGLFRKYRKTPNLSICGFTQVDPIRRRFQINLRNHRKIVVIDGRIAYTGGINIHRGHMVQSSREAIRDYHFRVEGPITHELQYTFLRDWYYMTEEDPQTLLSPELFTSIPPVGNKGIPMRLVNGGPTRETEPMSDLFLTAIASAQRQIIASSPYFVPPPALLRAIRVAGLRGIDVRLVIPHRSNHLTATYAGRAVYEDLLRAGVRIFLAQPPLLHAKIMVLDDSVAIVGSANLDYRSLRLNYETNLVVFDPARAAEFKLCIIGEMQRSREIAESEWNGRSGLSRLIENFCYLLSPAL